MDQPAITYGPAAAVRRLLAYAALFVLLGALALRVAALPWRGDDELHTLLELAATLIAADVGLNALVRYYTQQDDTFLYIGSGFLGTAFLNGYHAAVTSAYFAPLFPSAPISLVPWSGLSPRVFLAVALFLSWAHWYRQERMGVEKAAEPKPVYAIFTALTLVSFALFVFVSLPSGIEASTRIPRPQESLPLIIVVLTLAGFLYKGKWRVDPFEHWLVISLITSLVADSILALSQRLNDAPYVTFHLLKIASFAFVHIGLLSNMRTLFRQATSKAMLVVSTATGAVVDCNQRLCDLLGYSRREIMKRGLSSVLLGSPPWDESGALERAWTAKDGRRLWVELTPQSLRFDGKGEFFAATVRDITGRKRAQDERDRRDRILHAVTVAAARLAASPLAANLPAALEIIGEALGVSRVMVLRNSLEGAQEIEIIAAWQASGIPVMLPAPGVFSVGDAEALMRWHAPLAKGEAVMTVARTADPAIRHLLHGIGVKSILLLPIFSEDTLWGVIGIDDCDRERSWNLAETDALGTLAEMIGSLAAREGTLASLHRSEEEFHTIFSSVSEGIFVVDPTTGCFLEVNPQACTMFGYSRGELIGRTVDALSPDVSLEVIASDVAASKAEERSATFERQARTKDGRTFWIEVSIRGATFRAREVMLATVRDVTERKEARDQLARIARIDALTGLPNRREFVEVLSREIARCKRDRARCAVLYLDLDHFKDVNDTLGHPAGDLLLQAVAERLKASIRVADSLARFGGDEFAVLQTDLRDPTDAALLATKLVEAISAPIRIDTNEVRSGASVGIAVQEGESNDAEAVLCYADVALYRAKAEGRGTYRFFTEAMDAEVRKRVSLAGELRRAIEENELYLVYQPQVEIETGRIVGIEALVRWRHPQRGMISPSEFIGVAEESGLIVALGKWVLCEACRQMRRWLDAGIAPQSVAVNVSALQFRSALELERDIAAILRETGVAPERLELELTESVLMEVWREHNDILQRLHHAGVRIAIDDFGTGYSSLDYLHRYPVDHIKIAQVFVADPQSDPGAMAIVKAAIGLAHDLNLGVIVEGVESAAQAQQLRAWGCGEVQGYHYARPLPADEVARLLTTGRISPADAEAELA